MKRAVSSAALILLCAGLVFLFAGCAKEKEGWKRFGSSDEGTHSYDPESVFRKTEAIVAVTEKVKQGNSWKTYRVEFHCTEKLYVRTLMKSSVSEGGEEAARFPQLASRPPMEEVPPGTPAEKLFEVVCE